MQWTGPVSLPLSADQLSPCLKPINAPPSPSSTTTTEPGVPGRYGGLSDEVPLHSCNALTPSEREAFERDGFVILRGLVPEDECRRFLWQSVEPALRRRGVAYDDESTWGGKLGEAIGAPDGGDHPIPPSSPDARWPALFESPRLRQILDDLHGGKRHWQWVHGASRGVGWIHVRYPVIEPSEAWDWESRRWHIDGDTGRIDTHQSVVVLPMVTPIAAGGGGTALLQGSHKTVARWLHDNGEWGVGNHRRVRTIVEQALEARGLSAIVEATGAAGDVLLMHPLLIHAVNDARRVTFHLSEEGSGQPRWKAVHHGIRVTFNLSTHWTRQPLTIPEWDDGKQPRTLLEHSLVAPISEGTTHSERVLLYGDVLELRFVESGTMLGVHPEHKGLAIAREWRYPAKVAHDLRFHSAGLPKGGAGAPVCYGDEVVLKCRGENGAWHRLGVTAVRDLDSKVRALCAPRESRVLCVQWGERHTTAEQTFRIEGFCDLRGVPLRAGDKFYLRAVGCVHDGARHGCHLHADSEVADAERHVGARFCCRESMHEIEAFKVHTDRTRSTR